MSFYKSQAQGSICYKQLKVVDHMNLSGSWGHDFICYEQL